MEGSVTLDEIAALEALHAKLARTHWEVVLSDDGHGNPVYALCDVYGDVGLDAIDLETAEFVAKAHAALPDLLALARRALEHERAAEPGANPLDRPEVCEAVTFAFACAHRLLAVNSTVREDAIMNATWDAVLVTLAPFVAAAQRAAFRAGVEAAAGVCDKAMAALHQREGDLYAAGLRGQAELMGVAATRSMLLAGTIRELPVPAGFAAPGLSMEALHAEFWRGRTRGREDAVEACQRYAALLREEARECHEACDDVGEAEASTRASAAEGCAAFIEQLGPVEDADPGFAAPGPGYLEALRPFAEIGQWLFARDLPDDTPVVEAGGINGYAMTLTRGHFKAAHRALREAEAGAADEPGETTDARA